MNFNGTSANDMQVSGDHYAKKQFQTWDVILDWNLGFLDGCAVKYLSRWRDKGGRTDILKAIHYLQKLLEVIDNQEHPQHMAQTKDENEPKTYLQRLREVSEKNPRY